MIEIFDVEQNSEEWRRARLGLITASNFATVLAKGKSGGDSVTRRKLLYQLAGEIVTGEPAENFTNGYMDRGHVMEDEARDLYAFIHDAEPQRVGFVKNGDKGCSPDSLIGDKGGLEIKSKSPHLLIEVLFREEGIPPEHVAQVQGSMWVCEREFWDFMAFFRGMPPFIRRVHRDEAYITKLAAAVDEFNAELADVVERVKNYGSRAA